MGPVQQFVGEKRSETISLHCWPGAPGLLRWYEDDGRSLAYEAGCFSEREIRANLSETGGTLSFGPAQGEFASEVKRWQVVLHDVAHRRRKAAVNGRRLSETFNPHKSDFTYEFQNSPAGLELRVAP